MPKGRKHYRIKLEDAIEAHETALTLGGQPGIVNSNSIMSAIARPYDGYHREIWKKGAALFESICRNHGFTDGNKRTAVLLLGLLLERSGYELVPICGEDFDDAIENFAVSVADGKMSIEEIQGWLKSRIDVDQNQV